MVIPCRAPPHTQGGGGLQEWRTQQKWCCYLFDFRKCVWVWCPAATLRAESRAALTWLALTHSGSGWPWAWAGAHPWTGLLPPLSGLPFFAVLPRWSPGARSPGPLWNAEALSREGLGPQCLHCPKWRWGLGRCRPLGGFLPLSPPPPTPLPPQSCFLFQSALLGSRAVPTGDQD